MGIDKTVAEDLTDAQGTLNPSLATCFSREYNKLAFPFQNAVQVWEGSIPHPTPCEEYCHTCTHEKPFLKSHRALEAASDNKPGQKTGSKALLHTNVSYAYQWSYWFLISFLQMLQIFSHLVYSWGCKTTSDSKVLTLVC